MKTPHPKLHSLKRSWHLVDLKEANLGRSATQIAHLLIGKHKPSYSPHLDLGDYVVVINSDHLQMSGNKLADKLYQHHSGYPGGFKARTAKEQLQRDSRKIVEHAVRGMLPKNKLLNPRLRRLKIYKQGEHPHANHFSG